MKAIITDSMLADRFLARMRRVPDGTISCGHPYWHGLAIHKAFIAGLDAQRRRAAEQSPPAKMQLTRAGKSMSAKIRRKSPPRR